MYVKPSGRTIRPNLAMDQGIGVLAYRFFLPRILFCACPITDLPWTGVGKNDGHHQDWEKRTAMVRMHTWPHAHTKNVCQTLRNLFSRIIEISWGNQNISKTFQTLAFFIVNCPMFLNSLICASAFRLVQQNVRVPPYQIRNPHKSSLRFCKNKGVLILGFKNIVKLYTEFSCCSCYLNCLIKYASQKVWLRRCLLAQHTQTVIDSASPKYAFVESETKGLD